MLKKFISTSRAGTLPTTRRSFLVGSAAIAGGLMVGMRPISAVASQSDSADALTGYIQITPDNKVTILSSQFDMGQGPYHGIATLVIEELGADWLQIDVKGAYGNTKLYGNIMWGGTAQGTGGSTSMATSFDRYRTAGAAARMMLASAAAESWNVPVEEVEVKDGVISHASGNSATFGEMAERAASQPVPQNVPLKDPSDWTNIGKPELRRFDTASK
ncbi:MAG: molybdopterin cofactor-binding domain-containing protein, partial [Pseudomonadota bacterium]